MINSFSIFFMTLSAIVSLALPIVLILFIKKIFKVSLIPFFVGILAFFISAEILEQLVHLYVLNINTTTSAFLSNSAIAYALYGGLAAGVFEESARFISYKYILKKNRNFSDGISYGLGHGGIESILIGGIASISAILNSLLINSGKFTQISEQAGVSSDKINQAIGTFVNTPSLQWAVTGMERMLALGIQVGLSIIVLYAVKKRKNIYFFIAILLHALIDFPAVLFQRGVISNMYIMYGIILVEAILILLYAFKILRPKFSTIEDNLNKS